MWVAHGRRRARQFSTDALSTKTLRANPMMKGAVRLGWSCGAVKPMRSVRWRLKWCHCLSNNGMKNGHLPGGLMSQLLIAHWIQADHMTSSTGWPPFLEAILQFLPGAEHP